MLSTSGNADSEAHGLNSLSRRIHNAPQSATAFRLFYQLLACKSIMLYTITPITCARRANLAPRSIVGGKGERRRHRVCSSGPGISR
jgi:hypothetical protein